VLISRRAAYFDSWRAVLRGRRLGVLAVTIADVGHVAVLNFRAIRDVERETGIEPTTNSL
jgi:hypothetical protein